MTTTVAVVPPCVHLPENVSSTTRTHTRAATRRNNARPRLSRVLALDQIAVLGVLHFPAGAAVLVSKRSPNGFVRALERGAQLLLRACAQPLHGRRVREVRLCPPWVRTPTNGEPNAPGTCRAPPPTLARRAPCRARRTLPSPERCAPWVSPLMRRGSETTTHDAVLGGDLEDAVRVLVRLPAANVGRHAIPAAPTPAIRPFCRAHDTATHLCGTREPISAARRPPAHLLPAGRERCVDGQGAKSTSQPLTTSRQRQARTRAHLSLALRAGNARWSPGDAGSVIDGAFGCIVNGPGEDEWPSTSMRLVICRPSVGGAMSPMPAIAAHPSSCGSRKGGCTSFLTSAAHTRLFYPAVLYGF